MINGGFVSGKTNALLNWMKQKDDDDCYIIDKIYLYVKDLTERKYQYLNKKRDKMVLKI